MLGLCYLCAGLALLAAKIDIVSQALFIAHPRHILVEFAPEHHNISCCYRAFRSALVTRDIFSTIYQSVYIRTTDPILVSP